MTNTNVDRLVEEANYLFPSLAQGLEKVGDNGVPYVSDKTGLDWLRSALSQARQEGRVEMIKQIEELDLDVDESWKAQADKEWVLEIRHKDLLALTTEGK